MTLSEDHCLEVLKTCYDPELPVNIVDLGLVYSCRVEPLPEGGYRVRVQMTLTAPGCAAAELVKQAVATKLAALPEVRQAEVELVFDPPWDPSRMSEEARLILGLL